MIHMNMYQQCGGAGGERKTTVAPGRYWVAGEGNPGKEGQERATGGGGSGASANWSTSGTSGAGSEGTSYSGGSRRRSTMWRRKK